jgi:DNA repair protein RadA/Sms
LGKSRLTFVCAECGYESPRWMGRCPGCGEWNSLGEHLESRGSGGPERRGRTPVSIRSIESADRGRFPSGSAELDRVLGGGIVPGSLVLIGGDPGIGKSTLLMQVCGRAGAADNVLYVSGEESAAQIRLRGERLGVVEDRLYVLPESDLGRLEQCRASTTTACAS